MQDMTNDEIISLLMDLAERFDSGNVRELISELEIGNEFMQNT